MSSQKNTVLVTGATGYIAGWCIINLLEEGYRVRGTVRELSSAAELKQSLKPYTSRAEELELVEADLLADEGWDEAVTGCEYVLHIASPFPIEIPEDEEILIRPAVDGTRRVLVAAARHGIRRVVLTSSIAAISSAQPDQNRTFTEADWSKLNGNIDPYPKSKTLAEKAAWEFMEKLPSEHPLAGICVGTGADQGSDHFDGAAQNLDGWWYSWGYQHEAQYCGCAGCGQVASLCYDCPPSCRPAFYLCGRRDFSAGSCQDHGTSFQSARL